MAFTNAAKKWEEIGEKKCTRCYQTKSLDHFTVRKSGARKGHPMSYCKECRVKREKQRYNNQTYERVYRPYILKSKYGITVDDYKEMLEQQGGKCAICGTDDGKSAKNTKTFSVDHCHDTGRVRGLLCNNCNRGIGLLGDNPETLNRAINYLEGKLQK